MIPCFIDTQTKNNVSLEIILQYTKIIKVGKIVKKKNNGRFTSRQNNKIIIYVIDMVLYKVLEALPKIRQQDTRKEDIHQLKMFMT